MRIAAWRPGNSAAAGRVPRCRLAIETLEERCLLSGTATLPEGHGLNFPINGLTSGRVILIMVFVFRASGPRCSGELLLGGGRSLLFAVPSEAFLALLGRWQRRVWFHATQFSPLQASAT